jgi:hypothetical protein
MVPVKRLWMAVKPVSNGEFCASAAIGVRKSSVKETAVKRAHFGRRKVWIRWIRPNWNQRDDICASKSSENLLRVAQN